MRRCSTPCVLRFTTWVFCLLWFASLIPGHATVAKDYKRNLLVYLNFDEQKGSVIRDQSGKNNHARLSGNLNFWSPEGIRAGAGRFTPGTRVIIGSNRQLNRGEEFSILMWVRPERPEGRTKLLSKRSYTQEFSYYMIGLDKGRPFAGLGNGESMVATPKTKEIQADQWQHIAVTFSGDQLLKMYVNGQLLERVYVEESGFQTTNATLSIGSDFEGAEGHFHGLIDELLILNKALTSDVIRKEANRSDLMRDRKVTPESIRSKPDKYLVAHWPLDDGRAQEVKNRISASHPGQLSRGFSSRWQPEFLTYALQWDGRNDGIQIPDYPALQLQKQFTLLCWIKPLSFGERHKVLYKSPAGPNRQFLVLGADQDRLYGGIGNGEKMVVTNKKTLLSKNQWQQIGMQLDGQSLKLILNGKIVEEKPCTLRPVTSNAPLVIGQQPEKPEFSFHGFISDVRIYNVLLPLDIITRNYKDTQTKLEKITKKRSQQGKIRKELNAAFKTLRELNPLVGRETVIEDIPGKELETLKKVQVAIKRNLAKLEKKKNEAFTQLHSLIADVTTKKERLNHTLRTLNQPLYEDPIPTLPPQADVQKIGTLTANLKRQAVEIDLLTRQKDKELELKRNLEEKKQSRLDNQIRENLKQLNQLEKQLGLPQSKLNTSRIHSDLQNYYDEVQNQLNEAEDSWGQKISKAKEQVTRYRREIRDLQDKINTLAVPLGMPRAKIGNLSSSLSGDLSSLNRLARDETEVITRLKKQLQDYEKQERTQRTSKESTLNEARKRLQSAYDEWAELRKKIGQPPPPPSMSPPRSQTLNIPLGELMKAIDKTQKLEIEVRSELEKTRERFEEKQQSLLRDQFEDLRRRFKQVRSRLLLLNTELGIEEDWPLPVSDPGEVQSRPPKFYWSFDVIDEEKQKDEVTGRTYLDLIDFYDDSFIPGKHGNALEFGGVSNYCRLDKTYLVQPARPYTLTLWFQASRFWGDRSLLSFLDREGAVLLEVKLDEKDLVLAEWKRGQNFKTIPLKSALQLKKWHHFTLQYDPFKKAVSTTMDGQPLREERVASISGGIYTLILGSLDTRKQFFSGALDDLRLYDYLLSPKELQGTMEPWSMVDVKATTTLIESTQKKIKKMEALIEERDKTIRQKVAKEEEERQALLDETRRLVKELNKELHTLGLPEYPDPTIARGQEQKIRDKFKRELDERKREVTGKQAEQEREVAELRAAWKKQAKTLEHLYGSLKQPMPQTKFQETTAKKDLESIQKQVQNAREKIKTQTRQNRAAKKEKLLTKRKKDLEQWRTLKENVQATRNKLAALAQKLGQPQIKPSLYPWENDAFKDLTEYYSLDKPGSLLLSDAPGTQILELKEYSNAHFYPGRYNQAPELDGSNTSLFLETGSLSAPDGFTVMFWIYPVKRDDSQPLVTLLAPGNQKGKILVTMEETALKLHWKIGTQGGQETFAASMKLNQWQHLALVANRKAAEISLYLNGRFIMKERIASLPTTMNQLTLGHEPATENYFTGRLDEFKIYTYPLGESLVAKGGLSGEPVKLQYQIDSLTGTYQTLSQNLAKAQAQLKTKEEAAQKEAKAYEEEFNTLLQKLNKVRSELGEHLHTAEDYASFEPEYRFVLLKSRIRRLTSRLELSRAAEEEQKQFAKTKGEIDDLWENLEQVLKELKLPGKKPNVTPDNAVTVLKNLQKELKTKQEVLKKKRLTAEKQFNAKKLRLVELMNELKELAKSLEEPLTFVPDATEAGIQKSLVTLRKLVDQSREKVKVRALEKKRAKEQSIHVLQENLHATHQKLSNLHNELAEPPPAALPTAFVNRPEGLLAYYSIRNPGQKDISELDRKWPLKLDNTETISLEPPAPLPGAIRFNGVSSYGTISLNHLSLKQNGYSIGLFIYPDRFWSTRTILAIDLQPKGKLGLLVDGNRLSLQLLSEGKVIQEIKGHALPLKNWTYVLLLLDLVNDKATIITDPSQTGQPTVLGLKGFKMGTLLRLGSLDGRSQFFSGLQGELQIHSRVLPVNQIKTIQAPLNLEYRQDAIPFLEKEIQAINKEVLNKQEAWKTKQEQKEKKRKAILAQIDTLKQELTRYTGQEKILFTVVIGEEEKALREIQTKVETARKNFEKDLQQKETERKKTLKAIDELKDKIENLATQLGETPPTIKVIEGKEKDLLSELGARIQELEKRLRDKELQERNRLEQIEGEIQSKTRELQTLLKTLGKGSLPVQSPESTPDAYLNLLRSHIQKTREIIEKQQREAQNKEREELQNRWNNLLKQYQSLYVDLGETPEVMEPPKAGEELQALALINRKVNDARQKLNTKQSKEKQEIDKFRQEYLELHHALQKILKELGSSMPENLRFNADDLDSAKASLKALKDHHQKETANLEEQKAAARKIQQAEQNPETMQKAIEKEKNLIRGYIQELEISNYTMPSLEKSESALPALSAYFKFDLWKNKNLPDETGHASRSFFSGFDPEAKVIGKYGFAVMLNGLDHFLNIEYPDDIYKMSEFTWTCWVSPRRMYGKRTLFTSHATINKSSIDLFTEDTILKCQLNIGGRIVNADTQQALKKNEWVHVALVISKNRHLRIYLNGKQVSDTTFKGRISDAIAPSLVIGSHYKSAVDLFAGRIDEFKIYPMALPAEQIIQSMEEETIRTAVDDLELLREEYSLLQSETKKLLQKVNAKLEKEEKERQQKVGEVNSLMESINALQTKMGLPPITYTFAPGEEDQTILDLKRINTEKSEEWQTFQADKLAREADWKQEANTLLEQIHSLENKLQITPLYDLSLEKGIEEALLDKARSHLTDLKAKLTENEQVEIEAREQAMSKEMYTLMGQLNEILTALEEPLYEISQAPKQDLSDRVKDLKNQILVKGKILEQKKLKAQQALKAEQERIEKDKILNLLLSALLERTELLKSLGQPDSTPSLLRNDARVRVYFHFDNIQGSLIKDQTSYGNHAAFKDPFENWQVRGRFGNAIEFSSDMPELSVQETSSLNALKDFSLLLWIKPGDKSDEAPFLALENKHSILMGLYLQDQQVIVGLGNSKRVATGIELKKDSWQHLALVYNHEQLSLTLYQDATAAAEIALGNQSSEGLNISGNHFRLGGGGQQTMKASSMDEFKLFSEVLSLEAIRENLMQGIAQIDPILANASLAELEEKHILLENEISNLRASRQKLIEAEKKRAEIQAQKAAILKQAVTTRNQSILESLKNQINTLLTKQGESPLALDPLSLDNMPDLLQQLEEQYKNLLLQSQATGMPVNLATPRLTGDISPDDNIYCKIQFEDYESPRYQDTSGYGQHAQFEGGGEAVIPEGIIGKALQTLGNGYLKIQNEEKQPYELKQSIQMWFQPNAKSLKNAPLFTRGNLSIEIRNEQLRALIDEENLDFSGLEKIQQDRWYHLSIVIDEFESRILVSLDGIQGWTKPFKSTLRQPDGTIYIGGSPLTPARFQGLLDEIRIVHRRLETPDFKLPIIYNAQIVGNFAPASLRTVHLDVQAGNASWMKVYQNTREDSSSWEPYRSFKAIPVVKLKRNMKHVTIIAAFKNQFSQEITQVQTEIPVPKSSTEPYLTLPIDSARVTRN